MQQNDRRRGRKSQCLDLLAAAALACAAATATATAADQGRPKLEYNRDIRPILAENCFACHGADSAARKADLRLDRREPAVEAGAIIPREADSSELIARIHAKDPKELMPPPATTKTLSAAQKETLRRWIAEGAEYQPHWSLLPPRRPALPAVKDASWARNPIDRFVLARLEENGLRPAPEADRRTLARRLSLDLNGLPPAPELVERFANDPSPRAYEDLVTRLLDSPRWGEHRARYWLDAARYADTNGYHFDNFREAWAYRDWVIGAFNRNLPYDEFTIEQLAGDLLPGHTLDQQVASGFNRCNATTNEGGVIPEEYKVLYARDRTETVSTVWMGLTAGCAVCHDHKYDPISQREFYELSAFFNNTTQPTMDGNVKDTPPTVFVPAPADRGRWETLGAEMSDIRGKLAARKTSARSEFDRWLAAVKPDELAAAIPAEGLRLSAIAVAPGAGFDSAAGPASRFESADTGDFEKDRAFSYGAWIKLPRRGITGAVLARMENVGGKYRGWDLWLEGNRVAAHILNNWPDDALKVVSRAAVPPNAWTHVLATYDGSGKAAGAKIYINGQLQPTDVHVDALRSTIRTAAPFTIGRRHAGEGAEGAAIVDVRIYDRVLSRGEVERLAWADRVAALARTPAAKRPAAELDAAFALWLESMDPVGKDLGARLAALEAEESPIKARGTFAHVMHESPEPAMAYLLHRGEYDKRRDPLKPATPAALPPIPSGLPRNRLGLATWLVRPEHPLTARVAVNRAWQEVFGAGLVRTTGDFGVTGELPSHPELLDWLAVEFRESGWDLKRLYRLMVESSTYRQSAAANPEKIEKDPFNRLLSRGPRFRMDAEVVRDSALAVGGLLVGTLGGPSVRPYQPEGVWEAVAMPESNTHDYRPDKGDGLYRRSLYTFWKRSAPPASMDILNAPNREVCTVRRERTNTPLQALVTLNDPQFIEAARGLAQSVLKSGAKDDPCDRRLDAMARRVLARPFRPDERPVVHASLAKLEAYYRSHPDQAATLIAVGESKPDPGLDPKTLAAWTMLANELMNLDEFLNK
jgi:hypothetical protein